MSKESPKDDPRKESDPETFKQTEEPWKGNPEKEQPQGSKHDLEKWIGQKPTRKVFCDPIVVRASVWIPAEG